MLIPSAAVQRNGTQAFVFVVNKNTVSVRNITEQSFDVNDLNKWGPLVYQEMKKISLIKDVDIDQQNRGLAALVHYDRSTAARFGTTPQLIDQSLYGAFGQAQVSTIYTSLNQYHVVMEAAPEYTQSPLGLKSIYIHLSNGSSVPLDAFVRSARSTSPLAVNHDGLFPAVTISFNLAQGFARTGHRSDRTVAVEACNASWSARWLCRHCRGLQEIGRRPDHAFCDGIVRGLHSNRRGMRCRR